MIVKVLYGEPGIVCKLGLVPMDDYKTKDRLRVLIGTTWYTLDKRQLKPVVIAHTEDKYYSSDSEALIDAVRIHGFITSIYGISVKTAFNINKFYSLYPSVRKNGRIFGRYNHGSNEITINVGVMNKFNIPKRGILLSMIFTIAHEINHFLQIKRMNLTPKELKKMTHDCSVNTPAVEWDCDARTIKFLWKHADEIAKLFPNDITGKTIRTNLTVRKFKNLAIYSIFRDSKYFNRNSTLDDIVDRVMLNIDNFESNVFKEEMFKCKPTENS